MTVRMPNMIAIADIVFGLFTGSVPPYQGRGQFERILKPDLINANDALIPMSASLHDGGG